MTEDQRTTGHPSHEGAPSAAEAAARMLARLTDLLRASLQTQASLAKQSVDLSWATLVGDLDRTSANTAYVESVTREGARYWRTVGELGVDYASALVTLGQSMSTTVLREVAAAGRKPDTRHASGVRAASAGSTAHDMRPEGTGAQTTYPRTSEAGSSGAPDHVGGARRITVSLRGSVGHRAEGTITVANQHPRPRRIQLSAGNLVDSSGAVVNAALDISPTTLTVPSGQERPVSLGIDLDAASFSAGNQYSCTVVVSGGDEATIEVGLQVSASRRRPKPA
jgi:hypothetical protein